MNDICPVEMTNTDTSVMLDTEKTEKQETFLPMLRGKATDAVASMIGRVKENPEDDTGEAEFSEVRFVIREFSSQRGVLSISTHKLLNMAIVYFTAENHTGNDRRELRSLGVSIPLKKYVLQCGYDITEHATNTPEEADAEAVRADNMLKNARRRIKKDLELLKHSTVHLEEKIKWELGNSETVGIFFRGQIKKGMIEIEFTPPIAKYLIRQPLTQYPVALLNIDERNPNAYAMGLKIAEHYNMDNNQIKGTAQTLKVGTLLAVTALPDADDKTVKRVGWATRIRKPFEKAMDSLVSCGLLSGWQYESNGCPVKDGKLDFGHFNTWKGTLVYFTLENAPDHTERLESRQNMQEKVQYTEKRKSKMPQP